jgi:hypothetical protein
MDGEALYKSYSFLFLYAWENVKDGMDTHFPI